MQIQFAKRMSNIKASEIRELLKVTEKEDVISFAGGLPAPELFPIEEINEINQIVLREFGAKALQYTTTEGYKPLREWIANRMNIQLGTSFDEDNILITHGSQQALDLSGKVFLDEGDVVLCESPTYLAAISAFKAYGCNFIEIPTDQDGMIMSALENVLEKTNNIKLIYVVPTFQNPTGKTWSMERRKQLAELSSKYNIIVIEDNPYGELRFEGKPLPSINSFDTKGYTLCTGSFSKIFCPGFRIGWIAGDKSIIQKYVLVKQGTDLQCNTIAQMIIAEYLKQYDIDKHIERIVEVYKRRKDIAIECIELYFPENIKFTNPEGGLFTWVELPENISAREILDKCLERKIAFVPGDSFFPNRKMENTLRINYSNMPEDKIRIGLKTIGEVINQYVKS
ncbi:2-aminoadipate transaminase [Dysgonomonas alginatilytica]|uniref:2-aminoadipate transaminase n=1 Tax=Dysgonomonas alginatilytica TaxID=1605892 RepID=A0A2V3Q0M7_9BACT|nr:PLP-dependent aminotransferase family protein [Dysgonomonas alginatilytica]PXV68855.1 2-aminoadipate transaminase [Dysgonomonas alginatilytica]